MIQQRHTNGFTLIETLVAISILLLVVIGPITVAQRGIKSAYYANEQVTAVFLTQEAIEAIRELRDTNALQIYDGVVGETWDWKDTLKASVPDCFDADGCAFDAENESFESCGPVANNDCQLSVNTVTGAYSYETGANLIDSGYTRKLYMDDTLSGAVSVRVEVAWQSRTFGGSNPNQSVVLETWLYDHYERYETF